MRHSCLHKRAEFPDALFAGEIALAQRSAAQALSFWADAGSRAVSAQLSASFVVILRNNV
jgi:hypothetical protein